MNESRQRRGGLQAKGLPSLLNLPAANEPDLPGAWAGGRRVGREGAAAGTRDESGLGPLLWLLTAPRGVWLLPRLLTNLSLTGYNTNAGVRD